MSTSVFPTRVERPVQTYLKAAVFLLPPLCLWGFTATFVFPKLQAICQRAGVSASNSPWVMRMPSFLMHYGPVLFAGLLLVLLLLELRTGWARHRRVAVGSVVFLLNSIVILGLTAMCISAVLAAPALLQGK